MSKGGDGVSHGDQRLEVDHVRSEFLVSFRAPVLKTLVDGFDRPNCCQGDLF